MSASSPLLFVYAILGVFAFTFAQHQAERSARYARAAPAPQPAQFDDLGWAWGKRSAAAPQQAQFEDLGWAWGKRSAPAGPKAQFEDLGWAWGKRSAAAQAPTKWEDLGWAWGKRSGVPPTGSYRIGSELP
ncbi:hypothetical protein AAVH_10891 [Aphelenchoides avenae]|nr:hypothetical protein AAVH_10891 [Aphelenchus avenae]